MGWAIKGKKIKAKEKTTKKANKHLRRSASSRKINRSSEDYQNDRIATRGGI